jgi:pimeloyl-ACP methyl ester carboxylesterase/DNA-binding CsgD family transcriptional regulator
VRIFIVRELVRGAACRDFARTGQLARLAGSGHGNYAPAVTLAQEIRFRALDGARIATASTGDGPPLVLPGWWVSNVEADWRSPRFRAFVGGLSRARTVIRYDRLGSGLSDRERPPELMSLDFEVRTLEAVLEPFGDAPVDMLGISYGGAVCAAFAARHPERVRRVVTFGAYAGGAGVAPPDVRASLLGMVRTHWGLGSRILADVWLPDGDAAERMEMTDYQRAAATPEMAAALLQLAYELDARECFEKLRAPLLILHRRGDRAAPFRLARELAALVPGARLLPLDGSAHPPWHGHVASVVEPALAFLAAGHEPRAAAAAGAGELSEREREVLALIAAGLSDAQIAAALVLSPHTVHRHVANIRAKLRQPTRAAAAAEAARSGLI